MILLFFCFIEYTYRNKFIEYTYRYTQKEILKILIEYELQIFFEKCSKSAWTLEPTGYGEPSPNLT